MATTNNVPNTIDVVGKYIALVKESVSGESIYIRAKETVQALVTDGSLDDAKKAEIVSSIIGGVVNSITTASMSSALEWAKYETEIGLKKLELDQQLLILEQDKLLKTAQVEQVIQQTRLAQIESKRMYGTGTFDAAGNLISIADEGKVWKDIKLIEQNTVNALSENNLVKSKIDESKAAVHKIVADTYINFGTFTYSFDPSGNGFSSITKAVNTTKTLSDVQKDIAIEQGKGYTYNAWANALTGSSSMLGTAIASGVFNFASGTSGDVLIRTVINCANNLAVASGTNSDAVPTNKVPVPSNITVV